MRSELLSDALQTTSSLQSPSRSAVTAAFCFVPLLDAAPVAVSSRSSVLVSQFHLLIQLLSSISRRRSASHHTAWLTEEGASAIRTPCTSTRPADPAPQNSYPG